MRAAMRCPSTRIEPVPHPPSFSCIESRPRAPASYRPTPPIFSMPAKTRFLQGVEAVAAPPFALVAPAAVHARLDGPEHGRGVAPQRSEAPRAGRGRSEGENEREESREGGAAHAAG